MSAPVDDDDKIESLTFPGIRKWIKSVKDANGITGKLRLEWVRDATRAKVIHSDPPVLILPTAEAIEGIMKISREAAVAKLKAGIIEEVCHLKTTKNHSPELFSCVRSNVDSHLTTGEKESEIVTGKMHRLAEAVKADTGQEVKHDTRTIEQLAEAYGISEEYGGSWKEKAKALPYRIYAKSGDILRGFKDKRIAEEQAKQIFTIGKRECELRGPKDDVICRYYFEGGAPQNRDPTRDPGRFRRAMEKQEMIQADLQEEYKRAEAKKAADDAAGATPKNESGPVDYLVQEATGATSYDRTRNAGHNCHDRLMKQLDLFVRKTQGYPKDEYAIRAAKALGGNILWGYLTLAVENKDWGRLAKEGKAARTYQHIIAGAEEHAREEALDKFGLLRPMDPMQELVDMERTAFVKEHDERSRRLLAEQLLTMMRSLIREYMRCLDDAMKDSGA